MTQLWFSIKCQRWNNIGSLTLNRRNAFNVVSTLFCQRWKNVDKFASAQLSFPTKFQCWNTVFHQRWIDVIFSTLFQHCFANVEAKLINLRRLSFHFQPNINVETTLMNVDDQRCFNVDSTFMCLLRYFVQRLELFKNVYELDSTYKNSSENESLTIILHGSEKIPVSINKEVVNLTINFI